MTPTMFEEAHLTYGGHQPEYRPLPAWKDDKRTISCWRLTWRERLKLLLRGRLWLMQLNFDAPLQPQLPLVDNPFSQDLTEAVDDCVREKAET